MIKEYWRIRFEGRQLAVTPKGVFISEVPCGVIRDFLRRFKVYRDFEPMKGAAITYLDVIEEEYQSGDVALISKPAGDGNLDDYKLGCQERSLRRKGNEVWLASKQRVASRGDESIGLPPEAVKRAEQIANSSSPSHQVSDRDFRRVRNKPLLMLHVLHPKETPADTRVPAFGISFPFHDDYTTTVEYEIVANPVWMEGYLPDMDSESESEDDDE